MKKLFLFVTLLSIIYFNLFSQGCLPEGIWFQTQEQIDNFESDYPGFTEIEGDVLIWEYEGTITNLNELSVLTSIGGHLAIEHNYSASSALTSLTGLEGLTSIGGNLTIEHNFPALTSLTGLEGLTTIGSDMTIAWNNALTGLTGLEGLNSIGGSLYIGQNTSLIKS